MMDVEEKGRRKEEEDEGKTSAYPLLPGVNLTEAAAGTMQVHLRISTCGRGDCMCPGPAPRSLGCPRRCKIPAPDPSARHLHPGPGPFFPSTSSTTSWPLHPLALIRFRSGMLTRCPSRSISSEPSTSSHPSSPECRRICFDSLPASLGGNCLVLHAMSLPLISATTACLDLPLCSRWTINSSPYRHVSPA